MRLEQLQAFLKVVETGSFHQAAQQCGVTQSTVSRQVQALELILGLPLFYRTPQIKLTLGGERFLPHAQRIDKEWRVAQEQLKDLLDGKQPEFCLAAIHSVGAYHLPPVLQKFRQLYPEVQLRVTSLGSDRALKVLRDHLVDMAIVMENPLLTGAPELVVDVLYEEPIAVLMAANHPLAIAQQVSWGELARYPQVVFKDGYGMQRLVQRQFQKQNLTLQVALEVNTLDAFRGIVRHSDLVAVLPIGALLETGQDPALTVRPTVDPSLTRRVVAVTTQDRLLIPPIQDFRRILCQTLGREILTVPLDSAA